MSTKLNQNALKNAQGFALCAFMSLAVSVRMYKSVCLALYEHG